MNTNEQLTTTNLCKMHKRKNIFCRFTQQITQKMCDTISSQQTKTQERTCVE